MKEDLLIYSTVENNIESDVPEQHYISAIQQRMKEVSKANDTLTADIVYAFLRRYQVDHTPDLTLDSYRALPYGAKFLKKGLKLDLASLPPKLICMLYTFLTKYCTRDRE